MLLSFFFYFYSLHFIWLWIPLVWQSSAHIILLTVIANPDNILPFSHDLYRCFATIDVAGRAFTNLYFVCWWRWWLIMMIMLMLIMMMSDDDNDDGGDDDVVVVTYIRTYLFSHWDLNDGYWNTSLSPKRSVIVICVHFDCLITKKCTECHKNVSIWVWLHDEKLLMGLIGIIVNTHNYTLVNKTA